MNYGGMKIFGLLKKNNGIYKIDDNNGTVLVLENLLRPNTQSFFGDVVKFCRGLYDSKRFTTPIQFFNWINEPWPNNKEPTRIINPIDITFGAENEKEPMVPEIVLLGLIFVNFFPPINLPIL